MTWPLDEALKAQGKLSDVQNQTRNRPGHRITRQAVLDSTDSYEGVQGIAGIAGLHTPMHTLAFAIC